MRTLRQIKDILNNVSKEKNTNSQILLRFYMMERLLERIAVSKYKNNFILKGGMLVSAMVGLEARSTIDMDTTIKNQSLSSDSLTDIFEEILTLDIDDGLILNLNKISEIRDEDDYPGFRLSINARLESASIPLKVDITTGDVITPHEIVHQYNLLLENRTIEILSYNIETILAEKLETILSRSIVNTRMRDFYDIYILTLLRGSSIDVLTLVNALKATTKARGSEHLLEQSEKLLKEISADRAMENHWNRYQGKYSYASNISWMEICKSTMTLWNMIF